MDELNFPVFKEPLPEPRNLSMEEYLKFIDMCHSYFHNRQAEEYWREKRRVTVPFRLE